MQLHLNLLILTLISLGGIKVANAVRHELRLYSGINRTGIETIITTKYPNITGQMATILQNVKFLCITGSWHLYTEENYVNVTAYYIPFWSKETLCYFPGPLLRWDTIKSLRFFGPPETSTPSLTLIGDIIRYNHYNFYNPIGPELMLNNSMSTLNHLGFTRKIMIATGYQRWTAYENENFSGNSTCYIPTDDYVRILYPLGAIQSYMLGCNGANPGQRVVYLANHINELNYGANWEDNL